MIQSKKNPANCLTCDLLQTLYGSYQAVCGIFFHFFILFLDILLFLTELQVQLFIFQKKFKRKEKKTTKCQVVYLHLFEKYLSNILLRKLSLT